MIDSLDTQGFWFSVENPRVQLPGRLTFNTEKGGHLSLLGAIGASSGAHPEVVLGTTAKGRQVTLWRCFTDSFGFSTPGFATQEIHVDACVLGAHFDTAAEIRVREVQARFAGLDLWAQSMPVSFDVSRSEGRISLDYRIPRDTRAEFSLRRALEVQVVASRVSEAGLRGVRQRSEVEIGDRYGEHFDSFWTDLHHFRDLLTLGLDQPSHVHGVRARSPRGDLDFYCRPVSVHEIRATRQPLFQMNDLGDHPEEVIAGWMATSQRLGASRALYFSTVYDEMYVEQRFLSLTQAAEVLHRVLFDGHYITTEAFLAHSYPRFLAAIPEMATASWRAALKSRLQYLHEYSLRTRLKELLDGLPAGLAVRVSGGKPAQFASRVADLRNNLTHGGPAGDSDLEPLVRAAERLSVLLAGWFLAEAGLSWDRMEALIDHHPRSAQRLGGH